MVLKTQTSGAASAGAKERVLSPGFEHQNALEQSVSGIDYADAESRYRVEAEDNKNQARVSAGSRTSSLINGQKQIISWEHDDPENPYNWSFRKKAFIIATGITTVTNSTLGSALPSNAIPFIMADLGVTEATQHVLPISLFLVGYIFGPLLWGPLSETYGRKPLLLIPFVFFTIFTLACAVAPNWPALIVFRFLAGVSASSPLVTVPGVYADICVGNVSRGRAMAIFMGATCFGPIIAPIISGYISPVLGWRWTFWIGLIIIGVCWPPLLLCTPETYGPVLLARRAARLRKSTSNPLIFAPIELEKKGVKQMITVTLTRPIRILFFELIVAASALYTSLCYAIFYILFTAYPLVFQGVYGMSPGLSGLMFIPIAIGACIAVGIFIAYDSFLERSRAQNKPWTRKEESRRLPLAYLGGPLYVISLFWIGWTARSDIPWAVPFLAGIPFGMGFVLIFMALLNYVTDAYEVFAASALAGLSCCRSLAGAVLPFAATPMYSKLGIAWGCSLLGFLSLLMCMFPFIFVRYGEVIRRKSRFCTYLREQKEKEARERELREASDERRNNKLEEASKEEV